MGGEPQGNSLKLETLKFPERVMAGDTERNSNNLKLAEQKIPRALCAGDWPTAGRTGDFEARYRHFLTVTGSKEGCPVKASSEKQCSLNKEEKMTWRMTV